MNFDEARDAKATMTPVYGPDGTAYLIAYAEIGGATREGGFAYVYRLASTTTLMMALGELSATKPEPKAPYGYCPRCGAKGVSRERSPNGNTTCIAGHTYPSREALSEPPADAGGTVMTLPEYVKICSVCHGAGEYEQMFCDGGGIRMVGRCDWCTPKDGRHHYRGTGYVYKATGEPVSLSVAAQIQERVREAQR